jgi:hypothetical protein
MPKPETIAAAISGGVDASTVAAALFASDLQKITSRRCIILIGGPVSEMRS